MRNPTFALLLASVSAAALLCLAQPNTPRIQRAPLQQTSVLPGQVLYARYCASCHGQQAKGDGPAAPALKTPPADLTTLSQRNGGVFPVNHFTTVLHSGVENRAHGSAEMPIWGDSFTTLGTPTQDTDAQVHLRIANLTDYLRTIQR